MDANLYIAFLVVSFGLIVIPGPNVLVIVSTSITHGKLHGLRTVAGTSLAMAVQLFIVAIGTAWFIQFLTEGFYILKWLGVSYLLYLGLQHLKRVATRSDPHTEPANSTSFSLGFFVSLTNPKTILFFSFLDCLPNGCFRVVFFITFCHKST